MLSFSEGWHVPIIKAAVENYAEPTYVEIGVRSGACIRYIGGTRHGVDIKQPTGDIGGARFWHMSSDEFFEQWEGPIHVCFIDGDHSYEQATRDFRNAMRHLTPDGVIFLHDTWPVEEQYTVKNNCGDVYRLAAQLENHTLFNTFTYRRWPGLTLVQRPQIERFKCA